jgi:hypothetical protein
MRRKLLQLRTALLLGVPSILRVLGYRISLRLGLHPVQWIHASTPEGAFFYPPVIRVDAVTAPPVTCWQESARLFGHVKVSIVDGQPPDWLANPLTGRRIPEPTRMWWQIPDFDPDVGDIKPIWELSRMDWVLAFAQRASLGDAESLNRLNEWLEDWCRCNPPYHGPNWKCGQEASIRVMHLSIAALILGQTRQATPALRDLIHLHLQRIAPTISYAIGQDNNHGTSEAAALFIGGTWLGSLGLACGERWARLGRLWLENRMVRLVDEDGSFSQYSLNYHRLMLDTICIAEAWRCRMDLPSFSGALRSRVLKATQWLHLMVDPNSGDGPNVGANDGARLLQLTDTLYRDFRPSVQLAMVLFSGQRAFPGSGSWDWPLYWLELPLPRAVVAPARSGLLNNGGFAVLRRGAAMAMLRYPRFRFRPSQADVLHLDLWRNGDNLLRDAGTYSYNTQPSWLNYFGGVASHNTVQFDGREQMPRLSRFLLGEWLKTWEIEPLQEDAEGVHFAASYRDGHGASHFRRVSLSDAGLRVVDELSGFTQRAVLRWRLEPGDWVLKDRYVTNGVKILSVDGTQSMVRWELVEGWESLHYLDKTSVPVIEIEVQQAGTLTTEYRWIA